ncbi:hypothetical protein KKB55_18695 [Myxococcota bacterium]|nr:hypothetical protein [Myxococcota bacterium]MBU1899775.1 hypothetical protein [Myxococcota bacterium]
MTALLLSLFLAGPPPASNPTPDLARARRLLDAAEVKARAIREIKLVMPMNQLKRNLKARLTQTEALKQIYQEVIALGDPASTVEAMVGVADLYDTFAQALLNTEPPQGLSAEARDVYANALEQQVGPLRERALRAYQAALQLCLSKAVRSDLRPLIEAKISALSRAY